MMKECFISGRSAEIQKSKQAAAAATTRQESK
jgi:hypothetical protein